MRSLLTPIILNPNPLAFDLPDVNAFSPAQDKRIYRHKSRDLLWRLSTGNCSACHAETRAPTAYLENGTWHRPPRRWFNNLSTGILGSANRSHLLVQSSLKVSLGRASSAYHWGKKIQRSFLR